MCVMMLNPDWVQAHLGIFNFYSPVTKGSGLGLTIVRRVVEIHGGQVGVESETGRGSTFWLDLPARPAPAVGPTSAPSSSSASSGAP